MLKAINQKVLKWLIRCGLGLKKSRISGTILCRYLWLILRIFYAANIFYEKCLQTGTFTELDGI
jgi:hypothetical protein